MTNINFPDEPSDGDRVGLQVYDATRGVWEWDALPGTTTPEDVGGYSLGTSPKVLLRSGEGIAYDMEYLVVGGGGSGRSQHAGGFRYAGDGGEVNNAVTSFAGFSFDNGPTSYSVEIGAGGAGWTSVNPGNPSTFASISSSGGDAYVIGGAGVDGPYVESFSSFGKPGELGYFGGSGGAAAYSSNKTPQIGGLGGGGRGARRSDSPSGFSTWSTNSEEGYPNTGGGGGGANDQYNASGSGGSGVVMFKALSDVEVSFSAGITELNGGNGQVSGNYKIYVITAGTGTVTIS